MVSVDSSKVPPPPPNYTDIRMWLQAVDLASRYRSRKQLNKTRDISVAITLKHTVPSSACTFFFLFFLNLSCVSVVVPLVHQGP